VLINMLVDLSYAWIDRASLQLMRFFRGSPLGTARQS